MSLYQLPLPPQELIPFVIPEHIHPLFVHFAIALPIVILIIELYNLITRRRSIAVLSLFFMVLLAIVIFGAILTGATDAKLANASGQIKEIILEHKAIATYLLYGVGVLIILKLLSMFVARNLFKITYVIFIFIFIAVTFYNGKLGGSLVYEYGVNVKSKTTQIPQKDEAVKDENISKSEEGIENNKSHKNSVKEVDKESKEENNTIQTEEHNTTSNIEANQTKNNHTQKELIDDKNGTLDNIKEENTLKEEVNSTN